MTNKHVHFLNFLDDPYYCGLRARIPNFVKKKKKSSDSSMASSNLSSKLTSSTTASASSLMNLGPGGVAGKSGQPQVTSHPFWWHSRLYSENPGQLGPGQFSKLLFICFSQYGIFSILFLSNNPV